MKPIGGDSNYPWVSASANFPSAVTIGQVIDDRYRIRSHLGSGGMGAVYVAEQIQLNRKVAIKVLRPELADAELAAKRFEREAHAVSTIDHPNVIQVLDFGKLGGGDFYLVMELLEGRDLAQVLIEGGRLTWIRAQRIVRQLVRGLVAVHAQGIIHRDIKPGNCFLLDPKPGLDPDRVKILDFGIAKMDSSLDESVRLTRESQVVGTAVYMAPEQAQSGIGTASSDIYALGVVVYELLTGAPPFRGETSIQTILQHITTPPRPLRVHAPELTAEVEAFVLGMLAKDPRDRYQSMLEVELALASLGGEITDSTPQVQVTKDCAPALHLAPEAPTEFLSTEFVVEAPTEILSTRDLLPPEDRVESPRATPKRTRRSSLMLALGLLGVGGLAFTALIVNEAPTPPERADAAGPQDAPALKSEPVPEPAESEPVPEPANPEPVVVVAEPERSVEPPAPATDEVKAKPKAKAKAAKAEVDVTFVAGALKSVEIQIAGRTVMLEPVKTLRLPIGVHKVRSMKKKSGEDGGEWVEAGTIEVHADKSYRATMRAPTGILLLEKD